MSKYDKNGKLRVCKALHCKNTLVWTHNHCTKHNYYKCQVCGENHYDDD